MRFEDCVSFLELEALMPPDPAAAPEALAPAEALVSSVLVCSSGIFEKGCTDCLQRKGYGKCTDMCGRIICWLLYGARGERAGEIDEDEVGWEEGHESMEVEVEVDVEVEVEAGERMYHI